MRIQAGYDEEERRSNWMVMQLVTGLLEEQSYLEFRKQVWPLVGSRYQFLNNNQAFTQQNFLIKFESYTSLWADMYKFRKHFDSMYI